MKYEKRTACLFLLTFLICASQAYSAPSGQTESIYQLNDPWNDQTGKSLLLSDLKGSYSLIALFYSTCRVTCPRTMRKMKAIEKWVEENKTKLKSTNQGASPVEYILVSVDGDRDSPGRMKAFMDQWSLTGKDWHLLRGSHEATKSLAKVLNASYSDVGDHIIHSGAIFLVDPLGRVKKRVEGIPDDLSEIAR